MLASRAVVAALLLGALLLGAPAILHAQDDATQGVVHRADIVRQLSALADDSMQGRMTGSRGAVMAARFIAREMRAAGLAPAGDSGFLQRVPVGAADGNGRHSWLVLLDHFSTAPDGFHRVPALNVVGVLRGSDPVLRDSVVLVDAHYDHLGIGKAVHGDSIYNGADDDASGTVAVLEIARALAHGPPLRRTVVFLATTGEEVGLLGTRWFVSHPVVPLARIEANLEIEMIGRPDSLAGGPGRGWLTGYERSTMGAMFTRAGLPIVPDRRPAQHFFARSDNIAFAKRGIPAQTLSSFDLHDDYHEPSDEVSRIDFDHMTALITAAASAVRLLANDPAPVWLKGGRP